MANLNYLYSPTDLAERNQSIGYKSKPNDLSKLSGFADPLMALSMLPGPTGAVATATNKV